MGDYTVILEEVGIEQCIFCGAHRNISSDKDLEHFTNCPVLNGDEAIAHEQAIINHIAAS